MGREIRRVPKNWQHPKRDNESFEPLRGDYVGSLKYYEKDVVQFIKCMTKVIKKGKVKIYDNVFTTQQEVFEYFTEYSLSQPYIADFMPDGKWYQLFENVSEGTPVSPPFKTKPQLIKWLTENEDFCGDTRTKEEAEYVVNGGYVPSGIMKNGKIYKSNEITDKI